MQIAPGISEKTQDVQQYTFMMNFVVSRSQASFVSFSSICITYGSLHTFSVEPNIIVQQFMLQVKNIRSDLVL